MEEVQIKIQNEIDSYLQKLEEIYKQSQSFDAMMEISKEVNTKHIDEISQQAKTNTEIWKLEKIIKLFDDESTKIQEIIQRASFVIRDT